MGDIPLRLPPPIFIAPGPAPITGFRFKMELYGTEIRPLSFLNPLFKFGEGGFWIGGSLCVFLPGEPGGGILKLLAGFPIFLWLVSFGISSGTFSSLI